MFVPTHFSLPVIAAEAVNILGVQPDCISFLIDEISGYVKGKGFI